MRIMMGNFFEIIIINHVNYQQDSCHYFTIFRYYPCKNGNDQKAADVFEEVTLSYNILSDPEKRLQYEIAGFENGWSSELVYILISEIQRGGFQNFIFVQMNPSEQDLGETPSSLNFASRVCGIDMGPAKRQIYTSELKKAKMLVNCSSNGYGRKVVVLWNFMLLSCYELDPDDPPYPAKFYDFLELRTSMHQAVLQVYGNVSLSVTYFLSSFISTMVESHSLPLWFFIFQVNELGKNLKDQENITKSSILCKKVLPASAL
ncbi:hypothetical protein Ancab_038091 [Ancistrocladus abbreviatus]